MFKEEKNLQTYTLTEAKLQTNNNNTGNTRKPNKSGDKKIELNVESNRKE